MTYYLSGPAEQAAKREANARANAERREAAMLRQEQRREAAYQKQLERKSAAEARKAKQAYLREQRKPQPSPLVQEGRERMAAQLQKMRTDQAIEAARKKAVAAGAVKAVGFPKNYPYAIMPAPQMPIQYKPAVSGSLVGMHGFFGLDAIDGVTEFIKQAWNGQIAAELTAKGQQLAAWQSQINALSQANLAQYKKDKSESRYNSTLNEIKDQRNARLAAVNKWAEAKDKYNLLADELNRWGAGLTRVQTMAGLGVIPAIPAGVVTAAAVIAVAGAALLAFNSLLNWWEGGVSGKMSRISTIYATMSPEERQSFLDIMKTESKGTVVNVLDSATTLGLIALVGAGLYIGYGFLKKSGKIA